MNDTTHKVGDIIAHAKVFKVSLCFEVYTFRPMHTILGLLGKYLPQGKCFASSICL
jgi:hypothetical protein